jgi:arylamine N-acetyltransferase
MTPVVTDDPWQLATLDLDGYLARLGLSARPPGLDALGEVHEAHVRAFTFDNIDVLLGDHPGVGLPAVQGKFVRRGRGGYCFEHTTLFAAALERLGYAVERRLGRVGDAALAPRTHAVTVVTIDGERWLADAGFGMSPLRPIPLRDGAEDDAGGWRHRVRRVDTGASGPAWELHRLRDGGWELMHTTDELPVRPVDVVMGHHMTSTFPTSHFRAGLMVTKHFADRHVTVTHEHVTTRRPGKPTELRPLEDGALGALLDELGVPLPRDRRARLLEVAGHLPRSG